MEKDLNIKTESLNLQEDKTGKTLENISASKDFMNKNPIEQDWNFILKSFSKTK